MLIRIIYDREDGKIKTAIIKETQLRDVKLLTNIRIKEIAPAEIGARRSYVLR